LNWKLGQGEKGKGTYLVGCGTASYACLAGEDFFSQYACSFNSSCPLALIEKGTPFLAYYLTLQKGLDPDKPRNLAKSVTVK